jgi:hypothetical protein
MAVEMTPGHGRDERGGQAVQEGEGQGGQVAEQGRRGGSEQERPSGRPSGRGGGRGSGPYEAASALGARLIHDPWAPRIALCLLLAFSIAAKSIDISQPCDAPCAAKSKHTLIFDESYYVNAARVIDHIEPPAGLPYHGAPLGRDPNAEHPQLAKLAIAAGIKVFGDDPLGWRFGSILFSAIALLALYALVRACGGGEWLAVGTSAVMALDNLLLVHGRIGTLDIYAVAMMLISAALYMRRRPLLAGAALGAAACMKEVALCLALVFLLMEALQIARTWFREGGGLPALAGVGRPAPSEGAGTQVGDARGPAGRSATRRRLLRHAAIVHGQQLGLYLLSGVAATLGLLALLDALVPAYDPGTHVLYSGNPFSHLSHMYSYAQLLKSKPGETGITSSPLAWLLNEKPINYARVAVNTSVGSKVVATHDTIRFEGVINPFIIFLAIPALLAALAAAWRTGERLAALGAAWCLGAYLPFLFGSEVSGRISYLYYMVIVMPGLYVVTARLFASRRMPAAATVGWAIALIYGFVHLYPLRTLL